MADHPDHAPSLVSASFGTCRDCGAFVDRRAVNCPVCGIAGPLSRWREARSRLATWQDLGAWVGGLAGAVLGSAVGATLSLAWQAPGWQMLLAWIALPLSALAGAALGWSLRRREGAVAGLFMGSMVALVASRAAKAWLAASAGAAVGAAVAVVAGVALGRKYLTKWGEDVIDGRQPRAILVAALKAKDRAAQLDASAQRMVQLRVKVTEAIPGDRAAPVLLALEAAAEATGRQRSRLEVELWRVALAQWQNQLQPALAVWRRLGESEAEREHLRVERAEAQLAGWIQTWRAGPEATDDRGAAVVAHANRLLQACTQLRQVLLVRQAVALAEGSPGAAEAFGSSTPDPRTQEQLDLLRSRQELGDYVAAAADVREELLRLKAEQEAIAEVERLLVKPV